MNRSLQKKLLKAITLFVLLITTIVSWAQTTPDTNGILYVKKGATGNGSSWANALGEAADALKAAKELTAGTVTQIWVSGGTYFPLYTADTYDGTNPVNRNNAFVLIKNVKLYGGFAGVETELVQRDLTLTANASILSGDFNENDVVTGTGGTLAITLNTENAGHIIISVGTSANPITAATVVDGFTITGANTLNTSVTVNGVSIIASGGGIFNSNYSSPTFSNLIIKENSANNLGAGLFNNTSSSPFITNCIISKNLAKGTATTRGGGIMNMSNSAPVITNTIISGNRSQGSGGGIHNDNSSPTFTNVIIIGNRAATGGGLYNNSSSSNSKIRNSIIYGNEGSNGPNIYNNSGGIATMTNSLVQGMTTSDGNGNIAGTVDPLFVDAANDNYMLQISSPLVDGGNNSFFASGSTPDLSGITTDLIGNQRIYGGTVDIGAYELMNCTVPDAPAAVAQVFCLTGTIADLTATTADGGEAKWYATADATEALTEDIALATQTYYVSQIIDVCESLRTPVSVTINALPEAPIAEAQTFCATTTVASLIPSPSAGILWYASADSLIPLTEDTTLTTQTYLVSQKTGNCEGPRTSVAVVINTPDPAVSSQTFCEGATVASLQATTIEGSLVQWYAGGTFGEVLPNNYHLTTGLYYVSQTIGTCESRRIAITVTITPQLLPDFGTIAPVCIGSTAPALQPISPNGISGTWSPSEISTTEAGIFEYVFTPTEGLLECTAQQTLSVIVTSQITPNFTQIAAFCQGTDVPALEPVSPNGITGTWSPVAIDNTQTGSFDYLFSPAEGQCATIQTLSITVIPQVTPGFTQIAAFCQGTDAPVLESVSPNGITGTWSPVTIDNTQTGSFDYLFTPVVGQCATVQTLSVTVNGLTEAPTGEEIQDFTEGETLAEFTVNGENIKWYDAPTGGNELSSSDLIVSEVVYYASQTLISGCGESINRLKVMAGINLATVPFNSNNFKYYPNPITDMLTIEYSEKIDLVEVFNVLGQEIFNKKVNGNEYKLNFSDIDAGSYFVKVVSGETFKIFTVIKK